MMRRKMPGNDVLLAAEEKVRKWLEGNGMCCDYEVYTVVKNVPMMAVEINGGDWKHDHRRCTWLMERLGCWEINEEITEEDGSDYYASIHYYIKKGGWEDIVINDKKGVL